MTTLNAMQRDGLEYVRNTNGGATKVHFMTDWEPIGPGLWVDLVQQGWVTLRDDRVVLTAAGQAVLQED
jgi:hypothetical protein